MTRIMSQAAEQLRPLRAQARRPHPSPKSRADDERDLQFMEHWDANWGVTDIAAKFGVTRGMVNGVLAAVQRDAPSDLKRPYGGAR